MDKNKKAHEKLRKPTAPPTIAHEDEKRYSRKEKHKKKYE